MTARNIRGGLATGLVVATLLGAGCREAPEGTIVLDRDGRRWIDVEWDQDLERCYDGSDGPLQPIGIRYTSGSIWINDAGTTRLLQLAPDGTVRRSFGRPGAGPGEFRSLRDMEVAGDGRVAVWDPHSSRVSLVDSAGRLEQRVIGAFGHAEQFLPLPDGGFLFLAFRPDSPIVRTDGRGAFVGRQAIPWPRFQELASIASQSVTVAQAGGATGAIGLIFGEKFFLQRDGTLLPQALDYVEAIPAPEAEVGLNRDGDSVIALPMVPMTGADLALTPQTLFVLFGGRTERRHRQLDAYAAGSGRYRYSLELPAPVDYFTVADGAVLGVVTTDRTCLRRYRPRPPRDSLLR